LSPFRISNQGLTHPLTSWINHLFALCLVLLSVPGVVAAQTNASAADTLSAIAERGSFVIGTDIPYGVMEFYDANGTATGIDIEMARQIASDLDAALEIRAIAFDKLFDALDAGEIDAIVSAVTITQERQERMLFSAPYMDAGMTIAVAEGTTDINGEADLAGKRVGVLKGTVGADLMRKSEIVMEDLLIEYESNDARLADLVSGKIDAAIVHFASDAVPDIRLIEPPLTQSFYGVVTRLDDIALMASIDASLREMKRSGALDTIKRRFINASQP